MITWIGIDIAKKFFVACMLTALGERSTATFTNDRSGRQKLVDWVEKHHDLAQCRFCMESTGVYSLGLASFLAEKGLSVVVENPRRIKHFSVAMNLKCKTDKVDAYAI